MENIAETGVGELVANNYRLAKLFDQYGIDYCCGGTKPLGQVCEEQNIDPLKLIEEVKQVVNHTTSTTGIDFSSWSLELIIDYVVKKHHKEVKETLPTLQQYLNKLTEVHGNQHPELYTIKGLFDESAHDLILHMQKEEVVLFPYVKKMIDADEKEGTLPEAAFGTVENPIKMMSLEHDQEGNRFKKIRELTNDYTLPSDACNTYTMVYEMLATFERNLHEHIHLENNVIFPEAVRLEDKLI